MQLYLSSLLFQSQPLTEMESRSRYYVPEEDKVANSVVTSPIRLERAAISSHRSLALLLQNEGSTEQGYASS